MTFDDIKKGKADGEIRTKKGGWVECELINFFKKRYKLKYNKKKLMITLMASSYNKYNRYWEDRNGQTKTGLKAKRNRNDLRLKCIRAWKYKIIGSAVFDESSSV